jgi:hypothetical protein
MKLLILIVLMTGCASNPLENYDEYEMIQEYREVV